MKFRDGRQYLLLCAAVISVSFFGCARYKPQPLDCITASQVYEQPSSVSFVYKIFDKRDCKKYLDRDILLKGYQPVQITIINNTKYHLFFRSQAISLPHVSASCIARKTHTCTAGRATGFSLLGLVVWPFLIPAIVDGVGSSQANNKLDIDFGKKELVDQTISPYNTINGLIFVPIKEFKLPFTITLINAKSQKKIVLIPKVPYIITKKLI